jgi:hypothetical protein
MTRRYTGNMNGERYLGNKSTKEVHDLDNEKTFLVSSNYRRS